MAKKIYYGWVVVGVAFTTLGAVVGVRSVLPLFFSTLTSEFGWARSSLSAAMSIHSLTYGGMQPLVGRLADRWGAKTIILSGVFLEGLVMLALPNATEVWHIYLYYGVLLSVGYACAAATANTMMVAPWFTFKRGLAISISSAGFPVGQIVFNPLAIYLILVYGWRGTSSILALVLLLAIWPAVLLLARKPPSPPLAIPNPAGTAAKVLAENTSQTPATAPVPPEPPRHWRQKFFWHLAISNAVNGVGALMVLTHLPSLGADLSLEATLIALVLTVLGIANTAGTLLAGPLTDRWGAERVLTFLFASRTLGLILLSLSSVFQASATALIYLAAIFFGLTYFSISPVNGAVATSTYGPRAGTVFGWLILFFQVAGALGAYLAGLAYDHLGGYTEVFMFTAIASGAICLSWLKPGTKPARAAKKISRN